MKAKRGILSKLYPDEYIERFRDYDFDAAFSRGIRLILIDLDNTVVPHSAMPDPETAAFIGNLQQKGFTVAAVSNNDLPRVKGFCEPLGMDYVYHAEKPRRDGYLELMERNGRTAEETIFFGDQIFTDVWGAGRAGIHSILVKPVDLSTDEPQIKLKRLLERLILRGFFAKQSN